MSGTAEAAYPVSGAPHPFHGSQVEEGRAGRVLWGEKRLDLGPLQESVTPLWGACGRFGEGPTDICGVLGLSSQRAWCGER